MVASREMKSVPKIKCVACTGNVINPLCLDCNARVVQKARLRIHQQHTMAVMNTKGSLYNGIGDDIIPDLAHHTLDHTLVPDALNIYRFWHNPLAAQRANEMVMRYGPPDHVRHESSPNWVGYAMWSGPLICPYVRLVIYDRMDLKHDNPVPHLDFMFNTAIIRGLNHVRARHLRDISKSITYYELAAEATAGCHFRGASAATLSIIQEYANYRGSDADALVWAQQEYGRRIGELAKERATFDRMIHRTGPGTYRKHLHHMPKTDQYEHTLVPSRRDNVTERISGSFVTVSNMRSDGLPRQELRDRLIQLWIEHVDLTHTFMVSAIRGLPPKDTAAYRTRLLANQRHLADEFPLTPNDVLYTELIEHIQIAEAIVVAAIKKQDRVLTKAISDWSANGRRVAAALDMVTDEGVTLSALEDILQKHLDQTLAEAQALLGVKGQTMEDAIVFWDAARDHMVSAAKALADHALPENAHLNASAIQLSKGHRCVHTHYITGTREFVDHVDSRAPSSRCIYQDPSGRVQAKVVSLASGQTLPYETHDAMTQTFYVIAGNGEFAIILPPGSPSRIYNELGPGHAIIVPAGARHRVRNVEHIPLKLWITYSKDSTAMQWQ